MTQHLSSSEIVNRYLTFFKRHNHLEIPGSPLVLPGNSTSFVIAGMQPLLPYLRGQQTPPSTRHTSLQRCLRSDDIDAVGTNARKNSSFFMLGNWSIGDYGKSEAIDMALELLLSDFELDLSNLWVTVFAGDEDVINRSLHGSEGKEDVINRSLHGSEGDEDVINRSLHGSVGKKDVINRSLQLDEEAIEGWLRVGMPRERIVPLGADDNFWTMGGPGPCGPNSEIFVDRGLLYGCGKSTCRPGCACDRFLEIWNLVFMQYERFADGHLEPLPQRNIDTGMGLERTASVLQDTEAVFSIDLFQPANRRLQDFAPLNTSEHNAQEQRARRRIVDHTRAALLAGLAGVESGRDGRASVVRSLIRRASRQGRLLGIDKPFLSELVEPLAQAHGTLLTPEEHLRIPRIASLIADEETRFERVLTSGLKYLSQLEPDASGSIPGAALFDLHAEKGFPPELASEILLERGLTIDWSSYEPASEEHKRISRLSAERHFQHS